MTAGHVSVTVPTQRNVIIETHPYEIRLECMRLASRDTALVGESSADVVERAKAYADFVLGPDKP